MTIGFDSLGVVIVGGGAFGRVHADALTARPDATLVGIVSQSAHSAEAFAGEYGVTAYASVDAALADPRAQAFVIATPHDTHARLSVPVLAAGRHVLIEKPIAHTRAEADAICMAAASAPNDAICMIGHVMRFAPALEAAKALIDDQRIGDIVHVDSRSVIDWTFDDRSPWHKSAKTGGGMWLTQGVHVIDRVSWLLDSAATEVCGTGHTAHHAGQQDADDFGTALLRFPQGITAQLTVSGFLDGVADVGTIVHGTRGQIRVTHRGELFIGKGGAWQEIALGAEPWRDAMMRGEWDAFVAACRSGVSPITAEYGRYVLGIALSALSGQSGGPVQ